MTEPSKDISRLAGTPDLDHLTRGSIFGALWKLAAPVVAGNILFTTLNLVDMFWIGQMGSDAALTAVFQSGRVMMVMFILMMGLVTGSSALVSRAIGERDLGRASEAVGQTILVGLMLWALIAASSWFMVRPIFEFIEASAQVQPIATSYMLIFLNFSGFAMFTFALSAVLQAAGDTRTPLIMAILATAINAVLDPVLIFWAGLGVDGAAWASVIARLVSCCFGFSVLFFGNRIIQLHWRQLLPRWRTIGRILAIGLPSSLQMMAYTVGQMFLLKYINPFGDAAAAGYGICQRLQMVTLIPGFGLGRASGVLVGQNLGAKKPKRAAKSAWMATGIFAATMAISGVALLLFNRPIMLLFKPTATEALLATGRQYLMFIVPAFIPISAGLILSMSLKGAADTASPFAITVTAVAILLGGAWFFSQQLGMGLNGVWLALLLAELTRGLLMIARFLQGKWKHKRTW